MTSIIKNAKTLDITCTTSSMTTLNGDSKNVLTDNDNTFFCSDYVAPQQWWQVSFSKIVKIESYTIRAKANMGYTPMSWEALASMDGVNWDVVSVVSKKVEGNKEKFPTYYKVNCKHFRIVQKQNTENDEKFYLKFTFFDCFGGLGKNVSRKYLCFQNTVYRTSRLSYGIFLYILVMIK